MPNIILVILCIFLFKVVLYYWMIKTEGLCNGILTAASYTVTIVYAVFLADTFAVLWLPILLLVCTILLSALTAVWLRSLIPG